MHTALTVREEEFFPNYQRMWEGLPEETGPKEDLKDSRDKEDNFPAVPGSIAALSATGGKRSINAAMSSTTGMAMPFTSSEGFR